MKINANQYNPNFRVRPLAQWRCKTLNNRTKNITIASFEKKDIKFVQNFIEKANSVCSKDKLKQDLISIALRTIRDILETNDKNFDKVKMFIALHEDIPCGLLVGNIPKRVYDSDWICYSSRHNFAKNETELDWLVTWQPRGKARIKGVGKALVGEFYRTVKKDKFRDVFVRSELPENSYALKFYECVGFEQLGNKRLKLFNKNSAQYAMNDYTESNDDTIPMLVTRKVLQEQAEYLSKKMARQEFLSTSVDAEELINI